MNNRIENHLTYFALLDPSEQCAAVRRLANSGMADASISSVTRLSVEAVRRIIAAGGGCETCND